jgi:hypothetical protein
MKYTINTPKCFEKHSNTSMTLKYIYLPLKIHSYILTYIKIPSKYIVKPSLHTFGVR